MAVIPWEGGLYWSRRIGRQVAYHCIGCSPPQMHHTERRIVGQYHSGIALENSPPHH